MDAGKQKEMNIQSFSAGFPEFTKTWSVLQSQGFLKPLRSEDDYRQMVVLAGELSDCVDSEDSPLSVLFDLVTDLIGLWESHNVAVPVAEPREVLRYLLEEHDLKQKDLSEIASPTIISDILAGRRAISKKVAKALAVRFGVDSSVFI